MTTIQRAPARSFRSGLVALVILAGTLFLAQDSHRQGPPCLFRLFTRIPCPGCGLTRSLTLLWHGDFWLSFRYHPLGLLAFLICLFLVVSRLIAPRFPRLKARCETLERTLMHKSILKGVLALMLGLWVTRLALASCGNDFFLW
ncbi:MAG TPA: DUF2752 domain-containing protein [Chthonomonadaceae bacterium]|nr:DUF2752 domain-containing protein [Chthonomonadaceae bacterium]